MTEAEWLACPDPQPMLDFLQGKSTTRKWRLFACAGCRRIWHLFHDEPSRKAVEAAERLADSEIDGASVAAARTAVYTAAMTSNYLLRDPAQAALKALATWGPQMDFMFHTNVAAALAEQAHYPSPAWFNLMRQGWAAHCDVLRDIFGNPFRTLTVSPAWLAWNGGTIGQLALAIYEDRAFDRMPILADALLDAGCQDEQFLAHCRSPGPHVRGCWLIDLLLGKE